MRVKDITGNTYNHFKALDEYKSIVGKTYWKFECLNCGNQIFRWKDNVIRGKIKHCGCLTSESRRKLRDIDITNQKFTRLTAIKFVECRNKRQFWLFKCDCGNEKLINKTSVMHGVTKSCGCYLKEKTSELRDLNFLGEGVASFNRLFSLYRKGAIKRNLEFNLNKNEVKELSLQNCYYCNRIPFRIIKTNSSTGEYIYNGIDRVDNTKGYFKENVVPCCTECNISKSNETLTEFLERIKNIYLNLKSKGLINE